MSRFDCIDTGITGLKLIQRKAISDERGFLSRFYCADEFDSFGYIKRISQINHTLTKKRGAVRGFHYQLPPHSEIKLVSCLKGEIWDVAIDLRKNSPTFLKWHAELLSESNQRSLLIPEGFAHGFQALSDDCELIYLHSSAYIKESEAAVNANDQMIAINWPLEITEMSERDKFHPMLSSDFEGLEI